MHFQNQGTPPSTECVYNLVQRILKLIFLAINGLCPLVTLRRAEYPAFYIFCLYHKYTVNGHKHMIDLGRTAVRWHNHIVNLAVYVFVEKAPYPGRGDFFSYPSLYRAELQKAYARQK